MSNVNPVNAPPQPLRTTPADAAGAERLSEAPLSFAQERLWFLDQLDPGSHYNDHFHLRFAGPLDTKALEKSLRELVVRHEALRTTFAMRDGRPVQRVNLQGPWSLPVADLEGVPEPRRLAEALRRALEKGSVPFDLTTGPLWRFELLRLNPDDHLLLITAHHIAIDGWSRGVFLRELLALYDAIVSGRPSPLAELPLQMADFAASERGATSGPADPSIEYWKKELRDLPPALELPADRLRPSSPSHRGARQPLAFDRRLTSRLKEFGRSERATLFMTLLAGFAVLLHRYTGETDLVVGSPVANRSRTELEGLIGFFVNMLPIRVRIGADDTFRDLVRRIRRSALDAYEHQDFSFEELVRLVEPVRARSHHPLFQVLFAFQNAPGSVSSARGLAIRPVEMDPGTAKFDLTVNLAEADGRLEGWIEYATDLFDADRVERMAGHFQVLLEGIVADPDSRVWAFPLLTEAERRQVVEEWNQTEREYPREKTVHGLFEEQAERTPGAEAVVFGRERLSYGQLNERANRLARYLSKRGVGPEVLVGLCVERSLEMVVGLLGILKAGGAYVPLDPAYPRERLAFMLEDARVPVVLTQQRLVESLPESGACVVCLDTGWGLIGQESGEKLVSGVTAESLAYVIYTSGSTGRPKGVAIEHRSSVALLHWARDVFSPGELAGVLASTSICFDLSIFELFVPLSWGGKVILAENALELPNLPAAREVTLVNTVPSAMTELVRVHGVPASVSTVNLAGEPLQTQLVQQIYQQNTIQKVFDLYGPSEDTTYSTFALRSAGGPATIGRPVANTQVYILDRYMQPVPIGVPGELHIGGEGLARGYLDRAELTAERFIPNPFSLEPRARLYKTGDLARYLPDGNIQFLGRLDHQVKIRGYRIELGEIEAALSQHPGVRQAVAVVREDAPGQKRLVAYVVGKEGMPGSSDLRGFLKEKLPEYMVPSAFVLTQAIPLTPNGKADKRVLAALPEGGCGSGRVAAVAPRDDVERRLSRLWEEVLEIGPIGVRDNFFEIGGHSLAAVRLFARIEEEFGRGLAVSRLVETPTVEGLARALRGAGSEQPRSSLVAIRPDGSRPPLFLVHKGDGYVLIFGGLVSLLDPEQPVFGLEALVAADERPLYAAVPEMAAHYVAEVRSVQPDGPYFLGGSSIGGNVAFEMAQQLTEQGEEVALLVLFDSTLPSSEPSDPPGPRTPSERIAFHARNLWTLSPKEKLLYVRQKAAVLARRASRRLVRAPSPPPRPPRKPRNRVADAALLAWRQYAPRPYAGRVTLFRATVPDGGYRNGPDLGWGRWCGGGIEIVEIPGGHLSMFEQPYVRFLAERLNACLRRAHEDAREVQEKLE